MTMPTYTYSWTNNTANYYTGVMPITVTTPRDPIKFGESRSVESIEADKVEAEIGVCLGDIVTLARDGEVVQFILYDAVISLDTEDYGLKDGENGKIYWLEDWVLLNDEESDTLDS